MPLITRRRREVIPRGQVKNERELEWIKALCHTSRLTAKTMFHDGGIIRQNSRRFPLLNCVFLSLAGPSHDVGRPGRRVVTVRREGKMSTDYATWETRERARKCLNPEKKFGRFGEKPQ